LYLIIDFCIAAVLALDLLARGWSYGNLRRWIRRPLVWADFAVLLSLLIPVYAANLGFLRILRAYSMIHGETFWRIIGGGRWANTQIAESTKAITNLCVFIFVMSSVVHAGFAARVPTIGSFMDSLYFTVTHVDHNRLWRHRPAWSGRPSAVHHHHDRRCLAVLPAWCRSRSANRRSASTARAVDCSGMMPMPYTARPVALH
jgi:hypothetical protein